MRFAEVFLRLGASLVGWMMVFTYLVWMAALHAMGCGPDGDAMHRVLLGVGPLALALSLALRSTRPFPDIQRMLGRLVWPAALLGLFGLKNIWIVFERTHVDAPLDLGTRSVLHRSGACRRAVHAAPQRSH